MLQKISLEGGISHYMIWKVLEDGEKYYGAFDTISGCCVCSGNSVEECKKSLINYIEYLGRIQGWNIHDSY